ncbi:MAG: DUF2997 domain-containing protein [Planctomycetota bacterium]|nr:MAG: DUF2997 domain-containing protein [Planctomycetota bacterium]
MSQTIEVVVAPNGETRVETKGFSGASCRAASEFIERALGTSTGERLKPEFYQTTRTQQHLQEGS